jgi:hypothetical protein
VEAELLVLAPGFEFENECELRELIFTSEASYFSA